jgi:hypothetical protein
MRSLNEGERTFASPRAQVFTVVLTRNHIEEKKVMPNNKIKIDNVTGDKDKDDLKNCYFLPTSVTGTYDFYDTNNNLLASGLTSGTNFSFTLDTIDWEITNFVISDTAASGDWSNNNSPAEDQDGTFQAQAGGGADSEESASAATV